MAVVLPVALLASGCDLLGTGDGGGAQGLPFQTERSVYTAGSTATATLVNLTTRTAEMGICPVLERLAGGRWTPAPGQGELACPAVLVSLAPGQARTFGSALDAALPPGTYRLAIGVSVGSEFVQARTNPFQLVP